MVHTLLYKLFRAGGANGSIERKALLTKAFKPQPPYYSARASVHQLPYVPFWCSRHPRPQDQGFDPLINAPYIIKGPTIALLESVVPSAALAE